MIRGVVETVLVVHHEEGGGTRAATIPNLMDDIAMGQVGVQFTGML